MTVPVLAALFRNLLAVTDFEGGRLADELLATTRSAAGTSPPSPTCEHVPVVIVADSSPGDDHDFESERTTGDAVVDDAP